MISLTFRLMNHDGKSRTGIRSVFSRFSILITGSVDASGPKFKPKSYPLGIRFRFWLGSGS